jgi:alpha-beta hydrolase superfamily lysophospholipase
MDAASVREHKIDPVSGARDPEPLYFRSESATLFGFLHRAPQQSTSSIGVVICSPFGYEAPCAYQSMKAFAEAIAQAGFPALRLDYGGTGNSEDLDPSTNQAQTWVQDIETAVDQVRRLTNVRSVYLLGFRLGALLATLAAERCEAVQGVALVAPVLNGKRYVRELRTFELAVTQRLEALHPGSAEQNAKSVAGGSLDVSGYPLFSSTLAALSAVDLAKTPPTRALQFLILDRPDLPAARPWAEALKSAGATVDYEVLPGFIKMMMRSPDLTEVPVELVVAVCEWLKKRHPATAGSGTDNTRIASEPEFTADSFRERPIRFGNNPSLFGILAMPPREQARRRAVILLPAGADHHVGPRRMYVTIGRRWASSGYFVLRLDISGLGDSEKHAGRPGNEVFPPLAVDDIRKAVAQLRSVYGAQHVTLVGVCAGAFHAWRAALEGVPVDNILLVNPPSFSKLFTVPALQTLRRQLPVGLVKALKVGLVEPARKLRSRLRGVSRRLPTSGQSGLAQDFESVATRGVNIAFIFSAGDAGLNALLEQSGMSMETLRNRYRVRILEGADHQLTRAYTRSVLEDMLSEELFISAPMG